MHCSIYKGRGAPDTYLFVPRRDDFGAVPQGVLERFGPLEHVMDLVLTPGRPLARLSAVRLMRALLIAGCHVQLPPAREPLGSPAGPAATSRAVDADAADQPPWGKLSSCGTGLRP